MRWGLRWRDLNEPLDPGERTLLEQVVRLQR
jgi:hypothetical protein